MKIPFKSQFGIGKSKTLFAQLTHSSDTYRRNDFIGSTVVELQKYEPDKTHKLDLRLKDKKGEDVGQIELVISVTGMQNDYQNSQPVSNGVSTSTSMTVLESNDPKARYNLRNTFENMEDIGRMSITIVRAENLTAADLGGKSDPFAVVQLGNERLRTHTVYKTLHPEWNKTFDLEIRDLSHVLYITVFDEDSNGRAEFLGKIALSLYDIQDEHVTKYALKVSVAVFEQKLTFRTPLLKLMRSGQL